MFNEIGKKIKGVASAVCWIQIVIYAIMGIVLMVSSKELILAGFLVGSIGCLIAWLSSIVLYGFGEIIDKVCNIEKALNNQNNVDQKTYMFGTETRRANNNGKKAADSYYCGNCGCEGPYGGNCPICNSSLKKYYNPDTAEALPFQDGIKRLHTDEIVKRFFDFKEWAADYRHLCYSELITRGFTNEDIINSGNRLNRNKNDGWFCPECARVNCADAEVCKCGYKRA